MESLTKRLDQLAKRENYDIATLQEFRGQGFKKIFSRHTTFEKYAFHNGGRNEAQFNIGIETWPKKQAILRYGLAFSLEPGKSLVKPLEVMGPRIALFNAYVKEHKKALADLLMWCHADGKRTDPQPIGTVPAAWVKLGAFIFIGKYLKTTVEKATDDDLREVLATFDRLKPLYEEIEIGIEEEEEAEFAGNRLAKICWNSNSWQSPSGYEGKSQFAKSHEKNYGYGHEEWLFDLDKLLDGYHYGFLQPINRRRDTYTGGRFNIALFTVDSTTGQKYWVAEINNLEVIDKAHELKTIKRYRAKGWLTEMTQQVEEVGGDSDNFSMWADNELLFNVRFRPQDVVWYGAGSLVPFTPDQTIKQNRYTLLYRHKNPQPPLEPEAFELNGEGDTDSKKRRGKQQRTTEAKQIECSQLHADIQDGLVAYLKRLHPKATVRREAPTGFGTSIDIAMRRTSKETIFYEIKTYPNVKMTIREAVGQLMEYAYFPERENAQRLVIVSHASLGEVEERYLRTLATRFSLPLAYMQFDHEAGEVMSMFDACN